MHSDFIFMTIKAQILIIIMH